MRQKQNLKDSKVVRLAIIAGLFLVCSILIGNLSRHLIPTTPAPPAGALPLPEKWQFTATGTVTGALALGDDGTLYATSEDGFLYALDSAGNLQWKVNVGPTLAGPLIGADGTIYATNKEQSIFAINPTGTQQWVEAEGPYKSSMSAVTAALDQDHLYTPGDGLMNAVQLSGRTSAWSAGAVQLNGSVSILPNGTVVYTGDGRMDAVDPSGKIAWEYPVLDTLSSERNFWLESGIAVAADGTIYACAMDQLDHKWPSNPRLIALNPDGTYKWEFHDVKAFVNRATPVIATDGTIYFGSGDAKLYALNPDGTKIWSLDTVSAVVSMTLAEDGTIYVLNTGQLLAVSPSGKLLSKNSIPGLLAPPRAQLYAISIKDRKLLTRLPPDTTVAVSLTLALDGTIYIGTHAGAIVAIAGTHGGLMKSPWPKFQGDLANSGHSHSN